MDKSKETKGSWIDFRPEIKVLDCTIRDGGLMNDHKFNDAFVKIVYDTCVAAGVNYMELGYKSSKKLFSKAEHGLWRFCDEDDIRRVLGDNQDSIKLCAMADAERTDYHTDILPKDKSILSCIRVATYIHQIPTAVEMIKDAHDKGYETTVNLMSISVLKEKDLDEALKVLVNTPVDTIYLVDSFGSLYSEQIRELALKFLKAVEGTGKEIGIHTHNNQQLAYANTIEGLVLGINRLDATIAGLGRGAGNCPLELLLGFLRNPRFNLRPVVDCVYKHFIELQKEMKWGYSIPYMITGQLNQHPRSAIRAMDENTDYAAFYDKIMDED